MAVTLIIFIGDINTLHKGLHQRYKHIGCGIFSILPEGEQPFFYFFNISDSIHLTLSAVL